MKNKIIALLALVMVFALICTMGVAVFADDNSTADDASGETSEDTANDTADDEESEEPTWWDNYNQIIGWIIAAIIFVAIVLVSIWWIRSGFKPSKR